MNELKKTLKQLEDSVFQGHDTSALTLSAFLILGGFLAIFVRVLYRRFSSSLSDTDSISRVFPLLVIITTAVMSVVKSSLALSLGLVGALSIVRFRAAIKEPEELVYLFLCIAIGLALGAEAPLLAAALVVISTFFILLTHWTYGSKKRNNLLVTITGDSDRDFSGDSPAVFKAMSACRGRYNLQRLDVENGRGQARFVCRRQNDEDTERLIVELRKQLPDCQFSYVDMNAML